ncbi:MAG TPA: type II toxin-antitoxin system RelE/ParE family toxin [Terriglobales bacterium]|nr:type II toxin-antitoxin system RelE/ParE family toxin [Terriglobales bacterium]
MVWTIELTRTAERQIKKLDAPAQKSIVRFLRDRLKSTENPRQWGKPLHGDKRGLWRYRVGDFRLICDIQAKRITVLVLEVAHRKDVYR